MIPQDGGIIENERETRLPSKTFKIDFENKRIDGFIDGREAVKQAIFMALMTKRYKYAIFSRDYGTDFKDAREVGMIEAMGKVKTAITDSLMTDDRIKSLTNFEFERMGRALIVRFRAETIFGDTENETEVI